MNEIVFQDPDIKKVAQRARELSDQGWRLEEMGWVNGEVGGTAYVRMTRPNQPRDPGEDRKIPYTDR